MDIICAWCGKKIGEKDDQGIEGERQGICDNCLNTNFPHLADKIRAILEVENIEEIYTKKTKVPKELEF